MFVNEMRLKQTEAEKFLWNKLRSNRAGDKFRRQVDIGPYIVDFCCFSKRLIIELDGEFHKSVSRKKYDSARTIYLENLGYKVIRFWNGEVINDIEIVLKEIRKGLTSRSSGASLSVDT